jgi:hypothetical protein
MQQNERQPWGLGPIMCNWKDLLGISLGAWHWCHQVQMESEGWKDYTTCM